MLAEAGPTQAGPTHPDFYAGAIAAVVVILFAKFITHRGSANMDKWRLLHWICVLAAWLGLLLSLVVLGDMSVRRFGVSFEIKDIEGWFRWIVGVLVVVSGGILAVDVAALDYTSAGKTRTGDGRGSGKDGNEERRGKDGNEQPPAGSAPAGPRTAG
jgi:hypothetical protein